MFCEAVFEALRKPLWTCNVLVYYLFQYLLPFFLLNVITTSKKGTASFCLLTASSSTTCNHNSILTEKRLTQCGMSASFLCLFLQCRCSLGFGNMKFFCNKCLVKKLHKSNTDLGRLTCWEQCCAYSPVS